MSILDWHQHVSEREPDSQPGDPGDPPGWEDCVVTSGVMWARALEGPTTAIPATLAEAEALRRDAGEDPAGGMTTAELRAGLQIRYGFSGTQVTGDPTPVIVIGTAAVLIGNLSHFPAGHRLRRWDPGFTGGHAVFVWRDNAGFMWDDPLAPTVVGGVRWAGERATEAELRTFCGIGRTHTIGTIGGRAVKINDTKGEAWIAKVNASFPAGNGVLRAEPALRATIVARLPRNPAKPTRTFADAQTAEGSWRLTEFEARPAWLLYKRADGSNPDWEPVVDPTVDFEFMAFVEDTPPPADTTPYSQAALDTAVAKAVAENEAKWEQWVATHP